MPADLTEPRAICEGQGTTHDWVDFEDAVSPEVVLELLNQLERVALVDRSRQQTLAGIVDALGLPIAWGDLPGWVARYRVHAEGMAARVRDICGRDWAGCPCLDHHCPVYKFRQYTDHRRYPHA